LARGWAFLGVHKAQPPVFWTVKEDCELCCVLDCEPPTPLEIEIQKERHRLRTQYESSNSDFYTTGTIDTESCAGLVPLGIGSNVRKREKAYRLALCLRVLLVNENIDKCPSNYSQKHLLAKLVDQTRRLIKWNSSA
jgi:hypothetical protein